MPFETLRLTPGVDVEKTLADNAAGVSESQFVRWRDKLVEKRGGWSKYINTTFSGTIRELHGWQSLGGVSQLAVGTTDTVYRVADGAVSTITPQKTVVTDVPVAFDTTTSSTTVTVDDTGSSLTRYDTAVFATHASVGGVTIYGAYGMYDAPASANTYYITAASAATGNVTNGGATTVFTATSGSSIITMTLTAMKNPRGVAYAVGDTIDFPPNPSTGEPMTYVGGVPIMGQYLILTMADVNTATFNAQNQATTVPVTGASGDGATITLTYTGDQIYRVGDTIVVAGMNPAGYDGTYTVTAASANSVSAADAETGAFVSGGTIFNSVSRENGGLLAISYYITPGPPTTGTGYGILGYGLGGYGAGSGASSSSGTPIEADDWWFSNWGDALIACEKDGPIYQWSTTSGLGNLSIIPNAPIASAGAFVAMPQRQVMAWGTTYDGVQDPLQIRWSDVEDYNTWTATSTNQAGGQVIPTGSKIVRGLQGPNQCYWWTDTDLYISQYIGPPGVWGFNKIATGCGLIAPKAVGSLNSRIYWMSQKQFFVTGAGTGAMPLPCSVWDFVFQNLNSSYTDVIRAAPNSQFNEIAWHFPSAASTGENDSYVCYNALYNEWDHGAYTRTAWLDQSVLGSPIGACNNGVLHQHEIANDRDGAAMTSYFKTGYFSIANGQELVFVDRIQPDMKWGKYSEDEDASLTISFNVTDYPGDTPRLFGPYTFTKATQWIDVRFRGRFVQIIIQSSDVGSFWRIGSFRYRYAADGRR